MAFEVPNDGDFYLDPPASAASSDQTGLLVLVAPLTISTKAYVPLVRAVQTCIGDRMRLAGVVMQVDWQAVLQGSQMMQRPKEFARIAEESVAQNMERVRQEASSRGWLSNDLPSGRNERIFVAGHSAGGQVAEDYALKKTGGLILLASRLTPAGNRWAGLTQQARPILILGGSLDGQMRWTRNLPWMVESALSAATVGPLHAAATKPVILLEGVNHAQFGDDKRNAARGDIEATVSLEQAQHLIAETMADFLVAHLGHGDTPAECTAEAESLRTSAARSALYASAFTHSLGRGRLDRAWDIEKQNSQLPKASSAQLLAESQLWRHAHGAELLDEQNSDLDRQLFAHPGEVEAARLSAEATQRQVLQALPGEVQARIKIVGTVCTDFTTFTYNQPAIVSLPDGTVRIHVRCMLWREHLQSTGVGGLQAAPHYWLKLRQPRVVAWALGLSGEDYDDSSPFVTGSQISSRAMEEALKSVPEDVAQRYRDHGRKLKFVEDRDVTKSAGPEKWIKEERVEFKDVDDHTTEVSSSLILSPAPEKLPCYHKGMGLFRGSVYVKHLSLASCIEWIMLDCFKDAKLA
ncbi:g10172 [Coccomyxa viridis]|uniref:G10172 protein n=1 Tax=Coccomyxa viridis TaxID=1274662 RepID=A0ABP1G9K5_9CHLO